MTYADNEMVCDGCHRGIDLGVAARGEIGIRRGQAAHQHYHESCWLTGWYTGIEPKGEWPIDEAPEPSFNSTSINPFEVRDRPWLIPEDAEIRKADDPVNHPPHYRWLPNGVEVIDITETLNFCMGNAIKYILRADHKGNPIEDLKKAAWYIERELDRRSRDNGNNATVV